MILYFTGTGNSRYVAEAVGKITGDEVVSLNEMMKSMKSCEFDSQKPYVFAAPTYAWRMPRVMESFIEKSVFKGTSKAYFILTCGGNTGNACGYLEKLCEKKKFKYMGTVSVIMPENYIAMFNVPDAKASQRIIKEALPVIKSAGDRIKEGKAFEDEKVSFADRFESTVINPLFYGTCISAKGFYYTDKCIGCGKCERLCPLFRNISCIIHVDMLKFL